MKKWLITLILTFIALFIWVPLWLFISGSLMDTGEAIQSLGPVLENKDGSALWPLSLYLPTITADNIGISLVASVIMLVPALLIFLFGQRYLEQGITVLGIKE